MCTAKCVIVFYTNHIYMYMFQSGWTDQTTKWCQFLNWVTDYNQWTKMYQPVDDGEYIEYCHRPQHSNSDSLSNMQ